MRGKRGGDMRGRQKKLTIDVVVKKENTEDWLREGRKIFMGLAG